MLQLRLINAKPNAALDNEMKNVHLVKQSTEFLS